MKSSVKTIFAIGMSALMLTGCSSLKKVDYAKFHEEALNVEAAPETNKIKMKGSLDGEKYNVTVDNNFKAEDLTLKELAFVVVVSVTVTIVPAEVTETEGTSYYVGGGFKVSNNDGSSMQWDKYGRLTKLVAKSDDKKVDISVSYSK